MATFRENQDFGEQLLAGCPLDIAIDWIRANLEPEDVFDDGELSEWAIDNGFEKEEEED